MQNRWPRPSDVDDEESAIVASYLTLLREEAEQGEHSLRTDFNSPHGMVGTGASWRIMPKDLPAWAAVCEQTQRWIAAGAYEDRTPLRHRAAAPAGKPRRRLGHQGGGDGLQLWTWPSGDGGGSTALTCCRWRAPECSSLTEFGASGSR